MSSFEMLLCVLSLLSRSIYYHRSFLGDPYYSTSTTYTEYDDCTVLVPTILVIPSQTTRSTTNVPVRVPVQVGLVYKYRTGYGITDTVLAIPEYSTGIQVLSTVQVRVYTSRIPVYTYAVYWLCW